jgi:hypothetical protein
MNVALCTKECAQRHIHTFPFLTDDSGEMAAAKGAMAEGGGVGVGLETDAGGLGGAGI